MPDNVGKINWAKIQHEYVCGSMSLSDLAQRHGVSKRELLRHSSSEEWVNQRRDYRTETAARSQRRAQDRAVDALTRTGEAAFSVLGSIEAALANTQQLYTYRDQRQREYAEPVDRDGELVSRDQWTQDVVSNKIDSRAVKELTGALTELTKLIRNIYGLPTQAEAESQRIAAERLEMDRARASADKADTTITLVLPEGAEDWSK